MECFQTPAKKFQVLFINFKEMRLFGNDFNSLVGELISVSEQLETCESITKFESKHFAEVRKDAELFLKTELSKVGDYDNEVYHSYFKGLQMHLFFVQMYFLEGRYFEAGKMLHHIIEEFKETPENPRKPYNEKLIEAHLTSLNCPIMKKAVQKMYAKSSDWKAKSQRSYLVELAGDIKRLSPQCFRDEL